MTEEEEAERLTEEEEAELFKEVEALLSGSFDEDSEDGNVRCTDDLAALEKEMCEGIEDKNDANTGGEVYRDGGNDEDVSDAVNQCLARGKSSTNVDQPSDLPAPAMKPPKTVVQGPACTKAKTELRKPTPLPAPVPVSQTMAKEPPKIKAPPVPVAAPPPLAPVTQAPAPVAAPPQSAAAAPPRPPTEPNTPISQTPTEDPFMPLEKAIRQAYSMAKQLQKSEPTSALEQEIKEHLVGMMRIKQMRSLADRTGEVLPCPRFKWVQGVHNTEDQRGGDKLTVSLEGGDDDLNVGIPDDHIEVVLERGEYLGAVMGKMKGALLSVKYYLDWPKEGGGPEGVAEPATDGGYNAKKETVVFDFSAMHELDINRALISRLQRNSTDGADASRSVCLKMSLHARHGGLFGFGRKETVLGRVLVPLHGLLHSSSVHLEAPLGLGEGRKRKAVGGVLVCGVRCRHPLAASLKEKQQKRAARVAQKKPPPPRLVLLDAWPGKPVAVEDPRSVPASASTRPVRAPTQVSAPASVPALAPAPAAHEASRFSVLEDREKQQPLSMAFVEFDEILMEAVEDLTLPINERKIAQLRLDSLSYRVQKGTLTPEIYNDLLQSQITRDGLLIEFLLARRGPGDEEAAQVLKTRSQRVQEYLNSPLSKEG